MSELPTRKGKYAKLDVVFAPTLGSYRGRARHVTDDFARTIDVHAVCSHEHPTPDSAINCAAKISRIASEDGWKVTD